jgi:hypothetical protein
MSKRWIGCLIALTIAILCGALGIYEDFFVVVRPEGTVSEAWRVAVIFVCIAFALKE